MTRYKPVPEPRPLSELGEVQAALPLVPGGVEDCCRRLQRRADVSDKSAAQEWLPFLVALGLAAQRDGSYYRERVEPERGRLSRNFRERVYGASETLSLLAERDGVTATEAFEATTDLVPRWERNRDADWEARWRDRTRRLLDWGVVFGAVERAGERYSV